MLILVYLNPKLRITRTDVFRAIMINTDGPIQSPAFSLIKEQNPAAIIRSELLSDTRGNLCKNLKFSQRNREIQENHEGKDKNLK